MNIYHYNSESLNCRNADGYVNLTRIASDNGKSVEDWYNLKSTSHYLVNLSRYTHKKIKKLIKVGNGNEDIYGSTMVLDNFLSWIVRDGKVKNGFLYVLVDEANKATKIGYTHNPKDLIAEHEVYNPFIRVKCLYNNYSEEKFELLNLKLKSYRIKGEWYKLSPSVFNVVRCNSKGSNILTPCTF